MSHLGDPNLVSSLINSYVLEDDQDWADSKAGRALVTSSVIALFVLAVWIYCWGNYVPCGSNQCLGCYCDGVLRPGGCGLQQSNGHMVL